ncbi:hypothetical protein [Arthrobacter sp. 31Y]|uniref:hypothetical protein n=1 Tax=Arthrobacter sp. 31Y TaxID=1115632 RepID=UPI001C5AC0C9|nr:hypothetical protein [Arthrobacter sp. 31Y]
MKIWLRVVVPAATCISRGDQPSAGGSPPSYAVYAVVDNPGWVTLARVPAAHLIAEVSNAGSGNDHGIVEHDVRLKVREPANTASEQYRYQINPEFIHHPQAQALLHHVRAGYTDLLASREVGGTLQGRIQIPLRIRTGQAEHPAGLVANPTGVRGASEQPLVTR